MTALSVAGWHDDPISSEGQDRLGRAAVAHRLAELIDRNHLPDSSVVYGLEGPWGCGKSSVISLLAARLKSEGQRPWRIVTFTPWATSGTEGLLSEFFASLAEVASDVARREAWRNKLTTYMSIVRPAIALVPTAGKTLAEVEQAAERSLSKSWKTLFGEISDELKSLNTPVLVVVDDIDRLQPAELLDLLRVVRLLGRFPGVDFLLAYDEQTIVETLSSADQAGLSKSRARMFMEKIVQYPLTIPPLLTSQIVRFLDDGITSILTEERVEERFAQHRFSDVLLQVMPAQLSTPRAVNRYLAQLREDVQIHDLEDVDDVDLALTVLLRLQFPDVFRELQDWKQRLTGSGRASVDPWNHQASEVDWAPLVQDLEGERNRRDALAVLRALFPAVSGPTDARAPARRFAHPDYFDRYLAQGIPDGDVPDRVITEALDLADAGDTATLQHLVETAGDRLSLVVGKIGARYPDVTELRFHEGARPVGLPVLACCMQLLDQATDDPRKIWSPMMGLRQTAIVILRRVIDHDPDTNPDCALLCCQSPSRRADIVAAASNQVHDLDPATVDALNSALARETVRLLPILLDHLRQRDAAETGMSFGYLAGLVLDSSCGGDFLASIEHGLQHGDFSLGDVGARLVGLAYLVGGDGTPSSASFAADLFTRLTHVRAHRIDRQDVHGWEDSGWAWRRKFVEEFICTEGITPSPDPSVANED